MWIAHQALGEPIPEGWIVERVLEEGLEELVYRHLESCKVQSDHPLDPYYRNLIYLIRKKSKSPSEETPNNDSLVAVEEGEKDLNSDVLGELLHIPLFITQTLLDLDIKESEYSNPPLNESKRGQQLKNKEISRITGIYSHSPQTNIFKPKKKKNKQKSHKLPYDLKMKKSEKKRKDRTSKNPKMSIENKILMI